MSLLGSITAELGTVATARSSAVAHGLKSWWNRITRGLAIQPAPSLRIDSLETRQLQAEVLRLSRERAHISAENQLLSEVVGRDGCGGVTRLLRRLIPQADDGLAVLIAIATQNQSMLASRGSQLEAEHPIEISDSLLDQLRREPLLMRRYTIDRSSANAKGNLIIQDHAAIAPTWNNQEMAPARELFLLAIREDDQLAGVLITTSLWPWGVPRHEQMASLERVCQILLRRWQQEHQAAHYQSELWLAREMLRLKSISDRATEQPLETLGEFTAELCTATAMDRAALFLVSRRAGDVVEPVVEAGEALPPTINQNWRRHEVLLASSSTTALHGEVYGEQQLESLGITSLWGQAIACPLQSSGKRLGTLILSRRHAGSVSSSIERLMEWSSDLLSQTLRRIYRDAAIRRQARHDGLTDLANRRTFDVLLAGEVDRVRLGLSEECSLLLADLDHFKSINDRHGHQGGDEVLRVVAQLLREHVSRTRVGERSLLARYGGEELAVLLPGVGIAGALRIAEEIRAAIEQLTIAFSGKRLAVTVSIGVASCPLNGMGAIDLIAAADASLYRAKSEGRNRVCCPAHLAR